MNFGTFLALVFLIILWHVCMTVRHFITHILMDPAIYYADKFWGKKVRQMNEDRMRACGEEADEKKTTEKKTIGFKTAEPINEKEES